MRTFESSRVTPTEEILAALTLAGGAVTLRLGGFEPWSLTLRNDTEVDDADQSTAYRDLRHAPLRSIAGSTRDREIEVAVAPDAFVGILAFLESIACDAAVERSRAAVWWGSDWVMEVGTQVETSRDRLQPVLEEQVSGTLDFYADLRLDDLDLTVRQLRLRLPASATVGLIDADGVLLVDLLTDVLDRFADRSALVELANAPDVFRDYAEYARQPARGPSASRDAGGHGPFLTADLTAQLTA